MNSSYNFRWFAKKYLPKRATDFLRKILPESVYYPGYGGSTLSKKKLDSMVNLLEKCLSQNLEGDVIECGVFRGGSVIQIGSKMQQMKKNKNLYGIDTFEGHPFDNLEDIPSDGKIIHHTGLFSGNNYENVMKLIKEKHLTNTILCKGTVEDVLPEFINKKFCFVHLDLDLYNSTKQALAFLAPRLVKNGIIVFDDYNAFESPGVKKAVEEVLGNVNVIPVPLNPNEGYQAYWIKTD